MLHSPVPIIGVHSSAYIASLAGSRIHSPRTISPARLVNVPRVLTSATHGACGPFWAVEGLREGFPMTGNRHRQRRMVRPTAATRASLL